METGGQVLGGIFSGSFGVRSWVGNCLKLHGQLISGPLFGSEGSYAGQVIVSKLQSQVLGGLSLDNCEMRGLELGG